MKTFKINYKQQAVTSRTKPIQLVLNLNTKYQGKYLVQIVNTGISLLPGEWDAARSLPTSAALASKFLTLSEELLFILQEYMAGSDDENIFQMIQNGMLKSLCKEYIDRHIHQVLTPTLKYLGVKADEEKRDYKEDKIQRQLLYQEIKNKIIESGYRLTNQSGQTVDINWFFNLDKEIETEILIQPSFQPAPVAVVNTSLTQTTNGSCLMHEEDVKKYGLMTYTEFVDFVRKRKMKTGDLTDGKSYGVLINVFDEFDPDITVNELTDEVFVNFFDYLQEERDLELPSFNNYKKWINAVFNFASSQLTIQFNSKRLNVRSDIFNRSNETVTRPYLTEEMLDKLLNFRFDDKFKHLDYVRDLFYIQCYTSVTYVDLPQLFKKAKVKTVDGQQIKYASIRRKKTGVEADIMFFDEVYSLLEKYDFKFNKISNAYYNRAIKDMIQLAGFTDEFIQERFNSKTKTTTYRPAPFYTFIGSHTGRRSYITNMKKRGIKDEAIMSQSQHTSRKAYDMYVQDSKTINFENFVREVSVNK